VPGATVDCWPPTVIVPRGGVAVVAVLVDFAWPDDSFCLRSPSGVVIAGWVTDPTFTELFPPPLPPPQALRASAQARAAATDPVRMLLI
jgi:hypothetical protein